MKNADIELIKKEISIVGTIIMVGIHSLQKQKNM